MKSAFGVEDSRLSKSYLGAGKWGRAVEVGAKKLKAAPTHASAKGITEEDTATKRRMTRAWQSARSTVGETSLSDPSRGTPMKVKGRDIHTFYDKGPGAGSTLHLPVPGKSQRQSAAVVRLPENTGYDRAERNSERSKIYRGIKFGNPEASTRAIGTAARHFTGKSGHRDTYLHEMVHATKHRKPLSFAVRANRNPKVLWGEEARADSVMSRSSRANSGYREIARQGPQASDDLDRQYQGKQGPRRYKQVERQLNQLKRSKRRMFAVSSSGEATPRARKA